MKFDLLGRRSLTPHHPQRLTEQLYRTFKTMATLAAADSILTRPERLGEKGLFLRLGYPGAQKSTDWPIIPYLPYYGPKSLPDHAWYAGPEIQGVEPRVVDAEVFAAVYSESNAALKKSYERLTESPAMHRYVFFYTPQGEPGRRHDLEDRMREQSPKFRDHDIEIWAIAKEDIL